MAKFVIECPQCGKYAEGRTGIFARKKIPCTCGNTIHIRADRLAGRECPHCGNMVVFDQIKGERARCPVCKEPINTMAELNTVEEFTCGQCGIHLRGSKAAKNYVCPVCDYENDVQERIVQTKIKKDGLASIIKYEGDNDTFVWKHPVEDFNLGSQLIVHESQEAIFFRDGQALDLFGPGRYMLETQQVPLLEKAYILPTDTEGTFHSEVYFINKTVQTAIKWGTPEKVRFIDPLTGTPLELGASGELNMQVADSRKLLVKLVGTAKGIAWGDGRGFTKSIQSAFRPIISNAVKTNLPSVIKREAIDLLEIDEKLDVVSDSLLEKILPIFEEYGLTIPQFYVTNIVLPENDPNFKRIRELHTITLQTRIFQAEATIKTAQAQSETQYRTAEEQSRAAIEVAHREAELQKQTTETEIEKQKAERTVIFAQAEAKTKRMDGLVEAEIMKAKGYSEKDVLQAEVQKAYAEGIGNMGPAISSGGGSGILGDMLGLGVGVAAVSAVAPQIGDMMQGFHIPPTAIPKTGWNCTCGQQNIVTNFCPNCGGKKPEAGWTCFNCGENNIQTNFCPNCGTKKPANPKGWICPECGTKDIATNFCPNCGTKKPEESKGWICPDCGTKDIMTNFCPNCGRKQENL